LAWQASVKTAAAHTPEADEQQERCGVDPLARSRTLFLLFTTGGMFNE
jgi:hypothetical protein